MARSSASTQYDDIVDAASKEWNVDPNLLRAFAHHESNWNPNAYNVNANGTNDQGLMQLNSDTAPRLGVTNRLDPVQSIFGAAKHISQSLDKFPGRPDLAVAAYNAGDKRVQDYVDGKGSLPDTTVKKYIPSVLGHYTAYAGAPSQAQPPAAVSESGMSIPSDMTPVGVNPNAPIDPSRALKTPSMARSANDDFNRKWGLIEPAKMPESPVAPATSDFEKKWGLTEQPAAPGAQPTPTVQPVAQAPTGAPKQPGDGVDYAGWDTAVPQRPTTPNPLSQTYAAATNALAPAPNTTYGNVLPFAKDNTTGALRPALPQMWRDLGQGAVDLAFGPALGTVTPQATMTLANAVPGLTPAIGRTGLAYSNFPARQAAPAATPTPTLEAPQNPLAFTPGAPEFVPPTTGAPTLNRIRELIEADNRVAQSRPDFVPPGAPQPPNPLDVARAPVAEAPNALGTPTPTTPQPALKLSTAAREAAEMAAIPEKLPPAPLIPPTTETAALDRADQLIKHFSAGNPVTKNPDIVPGYEPKLSGLTNDPGIATLERGIQATEGGAAIGVRDQNNQKAIRAFTEKLQGAPEDVTAAQTARDAVTAPLRDAALSNAEPLPPSETASVVSQIDRILSSPEGKRAAVKSSLTKVRDSLHNADDELETDPNMLYGVRKNLNDLLDPVAQKDNPQLQQAARQLLEVKGHLDDIIEKGAPGFKDYIGQYAELSKPIDAQRYIQSLNLTNAADNVRLSSVDAAIKSIEKQRALPGVQKASAVSDEQLDALKTLRNTLRMEQFSGSAGKTLGSNTFQNLATNSRVAGVLGNPLINHAISGIGGIGGYAAGGPLGAAVGIGANMAAHKYLGRSEELVRNAILKRLLNHSETLASPVAPGAPWNPAAVRVSPLSASP